MQDDKNAYKQLVYPVIGACQEVHKELGAFLNEYMYQDALAIEMEIRQIPFIKEYKFEANYKGHPIIHKHFVDFLVKNGNTNIILECKSLENIADVHRQQLWNYMRLTGISIGILYNFAPVYAQCEKFYYDTDSARMVAF